MVETFLATLSPMTWQRELCMGICKIVVPYFVSVYYKVGGFLWWLKKYRVNYQGLLLND